jgi:hypothetical protein
MEKEKKMREGRGTVHRVFAGRWEGIKSLFVQFAHYSIVHAGGID